MPLEQGDFDRIQAMFDKVMPRLEYEQRHLHLSNEIVRIETLVKEMAKYGMEDRERLRSEYSQSMKEIKGDIETIKNGISTSQGTTLRYIISQIVSFIVGGGIIAIIEQLKNR